MWTDPERGLQSEIIRYMALSGSFRHAPLVTLPFSDGATGHVMAVWLVAPPEETTLEKLWWELVVVWIDETLDSQQDTILSTLFHLHLDNSRD